MSVATVVGPVWEWFSGRMRTRLTGAAAPIVEPHAVWRNEELDALQKRLVLHWSAAGDAIRRGKSAEEVTGIAVDIANTAMMIADRYACLQVERAHEYRQQAGKMLEAAERDFRELTASERQTFLELHRKADEIHSALPVRDRPWLSSVPTVPE